jgi:hypothetical protein
MWLGDVSGELAASSYVVFVLHLSAASALWPAAVFGEVTKAWVGARWGRRSLGNPMTADERWRVAFAYTFGVTGPGLAVLTALAVWPRSAQWFGLLFVLESVAGVLARGWLVFVAAISGAVAGLVLLRYLLLSLLAPRR